MDNKTKIGDSSNIKRKSDQLFSEIDNEIVMLNIENNEYYGMDKIGSRIWQLIEKEIKFKELISVLTEEYDVTEEQCKEDTKVFLEQLLEKKIIEVY